MKALLSPYLIIILAAVLGVATVAFTLLQQIPRLADMAVACLIKGGACMSSTLEGFLSRVRLLLCDRTSSAFLSAVFH